MSDARGNDSAAPAVFIASQWRERLRKAQFEDEASFALGTSAHWVVLKKSGGRPVLLAGLATVVVTTLAGGLALLAR